MIKLPDTTKIKNRLWKLIRDPFYFQRILDAGIVQNINYRCIPNQNRALVCYLAKGYFLNVENNPGRTVHYEIFKIVELFSELGYCVDVIDCNDLRSTKLVSEKKYNLIFGFGESFYKMTHLQPWAISILYMTENHPDFSFREEKKRIDYFNSRHKKRAKIERSGNFYKKHHLEKKYSHVLSFGEIEPLKDQYAHPYPIFPTGIINDQYNYNNKNHELSRKNYLWLGSRGAIHKGLDLLIDIFKDRSDITLHVCGLAEQEKKILDLPKTKHIIEYGHIDIKSERFLQIVETCSYIILPSCSEGCATSILTGMLHGLIPIVMKDAGFNRLNDNSIFLDDFKVDYINERLTELSRASPEELSILSKKVFDFARENFIISAFERNFRIIIQEILDANRTTTALKIPGNE